MLVVGGLVSGWRESQAWTCWCRHYRLSGHPRLHRFACSRPLRFAKGAYPFLVTRRSGSGFGGMTMEEVRNEYAYVESMIAVTKILNVRLQM